MKERSVYTRGVICTLIGGICWGFSGTCGQYLFDSKNLDSRWVTSVRMLSAGIILMILVLCKKRENLKGILHRPKDIVLLFLFGVLGLMMCQYTYLTTISWTNAGTATVLQYLGLILIVFMNCLLCRQMPTVKELCVAGLALLGTFLLATHGNLHSLSISKEGLFWGLLAAVSLMIYSMLPAGLLRRWDNLTVTGCGMMIAGLVFLPLTRPWQYYKPLDGMAVLMIAIIVVVGTLMSFSLYLQGVKDIGASKASVLACVEPVAAAVFSAVWLHTHFAIFDILGFAAILFPVLMLARGKR